MLLLACLRLQGQACNDLSTISLDLDCVVEITPDMVLEGTPQDSSYVVSLATQTGVPIPNLLTVSNVGDTIRATVTDTLTGNSCWGFLVVEDKLAPEIVCMDITLPCAIATYTPEYLADVLGLATAYPVVIENCGAYERSYTDTWMDLPCNDPQDRSAYIQRTWTVVDASGNQTSCTQFLWLQRVHADAVLFPKDTVLDCSNPLLNPVFSGQPYIVAFGINFPLFIGDLACELDITYQDQTIPFCAGSYTVLRTWTIFDDCLPVIPLLNPRVFVQAIKVEDTTGPIFQCPNDTLVSTDPFLCNRNFDLPDVILNDDCSSIASIRANWEVDGISKYLDGVLTNFPGNNPWDSDTLGALGFAEKLPAGITSIRYTVTDDCGNSTTCSFRVTVSDGIVPWPVCDEFTQVSLGKSGVALVHASTFDDGSADNCSPVYFKVRRVETNSCQPTDHFFDDARFCCSDVGDTVDVILRVYDLPVDTGAISLTDFEAHSSDCAIKVFVDDKLKPVCLAPLHQVINCEQFDPSLQDYGFANFADNCCLDTTFEQVPNYVFFDTLCNRGTIIRTFRAQDCNGQSSQCTQRLIINYTQNYAVKFPDDVFVNDCDTTGVYGPSPEIFGADCETIAISYQDNVSVGGILSCYWIERSWIVVDWCSYNANLPLIEVPNPSPAPNPLDPQNIQGPVVAPHGHIPAPTHLRVTHTDPEPTDYSIFWAANANGYLYRQIISVRDDQPPKIRGCPVTLPVEFCDHTGNDPQFWNAPYWLNPHVPGSTDLCEGNLSLAVTASDGCSKGNVHIRYLLFLDLDGDGVQETVINSNNPPPPNTVFYGNALNPNFTGGEPRAFDQRPVPPNEKYRFTIERAGYVNVTGYVRWATESNPSNYVMPQLPYGDHRIQWVIDDGCGNETICAYPIRVRDCSIPDLLCVNGLSVDIPQNQSITLYTTDFLWYAGDNCTPESQLRFGLRNSGSGLNFPFNPDGTPQQSVTFTCDELGTQLVELWVMDLSGNSNVCETYVIIQDNFGVCSNTMGTVGGVVKTEQDEGLEDVTINLDASHPALPPISMFNLSDPNGIFRFTNALPFGANLELTPHKDNDPLNGVSTFDLVLINKHILGQQTLDSPYKIIAADINGSRSVTTYDIVELRKIILGIYTEFPANTSWRFVDAAYIFPDPANPFLDTFPESRAAADMHASMLQEDFVAVKVGDVNGNAVTTSYQNSDDRSNNILIFDVLYPADILLKAGEQFTITLSAEKAPLGCQFTLCFPDLEILRVDPGEFMSPSNFAVFPDKNALSMSWDGAGKPVFALTFRARKSGRINEMLKISSLITNAEAYLPVEALAKLGFNPSEKTNLTASMEMERATIALRFSSQDGDQISTQDFELYPAQPNPWTNNTTLRFFLPNAAKATLRVHDQTGKTLWTQTRFFEQGTHNVLLDGKQFQETGLLYFQLETDTHTATRKMMRL